MSAYAFRSPLEALARWPITLVPQLEWKRHQEKDSAAVLPVQQCYSVLHHIRRQLRGLRENRRPKCIETGFLLKRPGFQVDSIMWMPRSPCRPLSVLHEHRGDAPLLIAAFDPEGLPPARHWDYNLEEPGDHHRQEVAHQREDEQRDLGDDNQTHDLDCAAYESASGVWNTPHHRLGVRTAAAGDRSFTSSSPVLTLGQAHPAKPEQGRGLGLRPC